MKSILSNSLGNIKVVRDRAQLHSAADIPDIEFAGIQTTASVSNKYNNTKIHKLLNHDLCTHESKKQDSVSRIVWGIRYTPDYSTTVLLINNMN